MYVNIDQNHMAPVTYLGLSWIPFLRSITDTLNLVFKKENKTNKYANMKMENWIPIQLTLIHFYLQSIKNIIFFEKKQPINIHTQEL